MIKDQKSKRIEKEFQFQSSEQILESGNYKQDGIPLQECTYIAVSLREIRFCKDFVGKKDLQLVYNQNPSERHNADKGVTENKVLEKVSRRLRNKPRVDKIRF